MRNFRTYRVWQHSIELVTKVYNLTSQLPPSEKFALARQLQRAAVSVPSNFAEGCSRKSDKEFKHFIEMALGSAFELETQMIITDNLYGLGKAFSFAETFELLSKVQAELNAFRNRLK